MKGGFVMMNYEEMKIWYVGLYN